MIATIPTEKELFKGFSSESKIWIYASDRLISETECDKINDKIATFTKSWTAHDVALKAAGCILHNRFVVLCVDQSQTTASGCSIDKSVHFMQSVEKDFGLNLFDRLTVYYLDNDKMNFFRLSELKEKMVAGDIVENSKIFDTTITQLGLMRNDFTRNARNSWLARFMN